MRLTEVIESPLRVLADELKYKYKLQDLWLHYADDKTINVDSLIVPKDQRKQGIGSAVMRELADYADEHGYRITLSPGTKDDALGTTSRNRLVRFYKQFGFKPNKGRNKDFRTSAGMIRTAKQSVSEAGYQPKAQTGKYAPKAIDDSADKVVAFIKKSCAPWLSQTKNGELYVYRGIYGIFPKVFVKPVRTNRKPQASSKKLHTFMNTMISMAGKTANRSNSAFVTSNEAELVWYGDKTFVVMPIGQFNYTWHTGMNDWAVDFDNLGVEDDLEDIPSSQMSPKVVASMLGGSWIKNIKGDDGTLQQAITTGNEIMIACSKILAIDPEFYLEEILPRLQGTTK